MLICPFIAIYFFFKFRPVGKTTMFFITAIFLALVTGALNYYMLDDVWWSNWILSPLLFLVGFFLVYLYVITTRVSVVEDSVKPRLDELFGKYQYRNEEVEAYVSKVVDLDSTPAEMIYAITTNDRYFQELSSLYLLLCEAYIHASQGSYMRAANAATELCKKMKINTKEEALDYGLYGWIAADPQLSEKLFSSDGKFIYSL